MGFLHLIMLGIRLLPPAELVLNSSGKWVTAQPDLWLLIKRQGGGSWLQGERASCPSKAQSTLACCGHSDWPGQAESCHPQSPGAWENRFTVAATCHPLWVSCWHRHSCVHADWEYRPRMRLSPWGKICSRWPMLCTISRLRELSLPTCCVHV